MKMPRGGIQLLFFLSSFEVDGALLDAGLLTREVTEVEDARAADFTVLVDLDAVDERGLIRENPLNTDTVRNLANRERLRQSVLALDLDHDSAELLETVLIAFLDPVGHGHRVTCAEGGEFSNFFIQKSLLSYFHQIHFCTLLSCNITESIC